MNEAYIKLGIAALLPVCAAVALYLLERKTAYGKLDRRVRQVICGILFGALAIVGTEWGIPMNGAQANCRDAAVLVAGLMFGAPAGILAGIIGGVERWIAVAWGVGTFTRVACTVSTILAGLYAAALRRHMFEDKKPGWAISLAVGVVMEVFHLTMVFITNMGTPTRAMEVVRACAVPMIIANGLSVMLTAVALTVCAREELIRDRSDGVHISQTIQRWLLLAVVLAFAATSFFVYQLQDKIALSQADALLTQAIDEVALDIGDASDQNMLTITHAIADSLPESNLARLAERYEVTEISVVDNRGVIIQSTEPRFLGFDMASGEQSAAFLCLLGEDTEYVQDYGPISYDTNVSRKYAGVKIPAGFVQVGYDAARFQRDIDSRVLDITRNRHVGQTGYVLILDESFRIVSAPAAFAEQHASGQSGGEALTTPGVTVHTSVYGTMSYCRYEVSEGYYIVSALPESEALQVRNIALYVNTFMEILVFAILFALIYQLIKRVVVDRIKEVNSSLARITDGDLGVVVNVRSNEEFASLSDDINSTVDTLKHYIDEASARLDKELELAKDIQCSALPGTFPAFPKRKDFDIFASMDPAKEVGGDFYDFYLTDPDTLNFLIADVSGKGIPAAMFMMRAKTELKRLTEEGLPLAEVFTHGNEALCEGNDAGMFVTAWEGTIDLSSGGVHFANAGHNPPLVRHADGKFEYLRSRAGFVLAGMEDIGYKTQELRLEPGDCIYLYTDGVTEATNAESELFGEERLLAAVNAREYESMQELCESVKAEVEAFVGEAPQFDDITMVALRFYGTPPAPTISFEEGRIDDITAVTAFAEEQLEKMGCPMKTVMQINIAIDELYSNIVKYAYPDEPGPIEVQVIEKEDPHAVYIRFADHGVPYNPLSRQDPDITLPAEERGVGGLGIYMVKKTMDDVRYKYEGGQNVLTIMKYIEGGTKA